MAKNEQNRTVTILAAAIEEIVRVVRRSSATIIRCDAGVSRTNEAIEYLIGHPRPRFRAPPRSAIVLFAAMSGADDLMGDVERIGRSLRSVEDSGDTPFVLLNVASLAGQISGGLLSNELLPSGNDVDRLDVLKIAGHGIERIRLGDAKEPATSAVTTTDTGRNRFDRFAAEIWSRSIGALGREAWAALRTLQVAVVGCGRSGSLLASSLVRSGVQGMYLIDPDKMEPHNLGEMGGVVRADLGKSKSTAVGRFLQSQVVVPVSNRITAVSEGVSHLASWAAVRAADVVFSSVDNDAARLAASILSACYLKPLIDVGTGVGHGSLETRAMGADVRLM